MLIWGSMSAKGVEEITFIDGWRGIFQHVSDPKHSVKITQGCFKEGKKAETITWPNTVYSVLLYTAYFVYKTC